MPTAVVNACGSDAVAGRLGHKVLTVDLRCDFDSPGKPGDLQVLARPLRIGATLASVSVEIRVTDENRLASGRAVYLTRAP